MFQFATNTVAAPAARLLRPELRLAEMMDIVVSPAPWRLEAVAMGLVKLHFPHLVEKVEAEARGYHPDWFGVLRYFLNQVDEHWFGIDWEMLDTFLEVAQQEDFEEDFEEDFDHYIGGSLGVISEFTVGIPVQAYGFSCESENTDIGQYQPLHLLAYCVAAEIGTNFEVTSKVIQAVNDNWDMFDPDVQRDAYERLQQTAHDYPPPLCYLGEMAAWVARRSDCPLMNYVNELWNMNMLRWTWKRDIDLLKGAYADAQELIRKRTLLCDWAKDDEAMAMIASVALGDLWERIDARD